MVILEQEPIYFLSIKILKNKPEKNLKFLWFHLYISLTRNFKEIIHFLLLLCLLVNNFTQGC
jgi:hypothetical protein